MSLIIKNNKVLPATRLNTSGVFTSKVNHDGLISHIDAADYDSFIPQTSVTNVLTDAVYMDGWGSYSYGNDGRFVTEFNTTGYQMINRGSWNGIFKGVGLPSTGTYTFSAWVRWWSSGSGNNGATSYTSGFGISDTAAGIDQSNNKVGVWQRVSNTINATSTSGTFYLISYGGTSGGSNSTWDVTMPMVEAGSTATSWINGANGTAGIDVSGNGYHVIKNANTGWNSNYGGAFTFNGSTSALDWNTYFNELSGLNPFTIEVWYKKTAGAYGQLFGNYGPGYGNGIWMFTGGIYIQGSAYEPSYSSIPDNTVYQLVCSRDAVGNVKVYRNAVLTQTGFLNGSVPANVNHRAGNDAGSFGEALTGEIYIIRVYNRQLNSLEVAENFQATRSRFSI